MIISKKCNSQLEDDINICSICEPEINVSDSVVCPQCGKENASGSKYCKICGRALETISDTPAFKDSKGKLPLKFIIVGAATFAICIVAVVSFVLFTKHGSSGAGAPKEFLYIKNNSIYHSYLMKIKPVNITDVITDGYDITLYSNYNLFFNIKVGEEGKKLFYPSNLNEEAYNFDLYVSDIESKTEGKIIDSNVYEYAINRKTDKVYYLKGEDEDSNYYDLYFSDLKNSKKIASEVSEFYINPEGTKLLYHQQNDKICIYENNKEENIACGNIEYASEELNKIYWSEGEKLYYLEEGKEKKKISNGFSEVIFIYDSGEMYFIDEDYNLCFYNKKESIVLSEISEDYFDYIIDRRKPIMVFPDNDGYYYVAVKADVTEIDHNEGWSFRINDSGTCVYYLDNKKDEEISGDLIRYDIFKKEKTVYDNNVESFGFLKDSDKVLCIKNTDYEDDAPEMVGDIYIDKEKIDTDVYLENILTDSKGNLIYLKDINDNFSTFTMFIYDGKSKSMISEDVSGFYYYNKESLIYMKDYDEDTERCDLYYYKGNNKNVLIDENISTYVPIMRQTYGYSDYMYGYFQYGYLFGYDLEIMLHDLIYYIK